MPFWCSPDRCPYPRALGRGSFFLVVTTRSSQVVALSACCLAFLPAAVPFDHYLESWSKISYIWVRASINVGISNLITTIYSYHSGPGAFLSIARWKNIFPELACEGNKPKECIHTEP
ncbi:uncharacterized protein [Triticum aestivum]|uniref:uncharacterized protein n=1 Tax=Triticum aestivum TaxID=4565 RepID=UPI0003D4F6C2|nr:uncharacterized protein LOC123043523 [Triticum aestivum]